jgi:oligopeptide/dipeptide ABC transporter ATP-binding protein
LTSEVARAGDPLVEVDKMSVSFPYPSGVVPVVRELSLTIRRKQTLVIVGESGSGKSITARAIMGLLPPTAVTSGSVHYKGDNLLTLSERQWRKYRATGFGIVFQDPSRSLNPTMRIGVQVAEALARHFGLSRRQANERAIELLDLVGIPFPRERAREFPYQLSGGMRQRAMIAIAISCRPQVLIADEPTTALDVTIQAQIMELLRQLQSELEMGILLITHDMGLAFSFGDEIAVMYGGRLVEEAPSGELQRRVRMPYTRGLLDSVPRLNDKPHSAFKALGGRPVEPADIGPGCSFASRCAYQQDRCISELPPRDTEGTHSWACWYPL